MIINATDADFRQKTQRGVVLVLFSTPYCIPCKQLSPTLEEVADAKGITLVKVNGMESQQTAARFHVQAVPTLLLMKDGQRISARGMVSKGELTRWLDEELQQGRGR